MIYKRHLIVCKNQDTFLCIFYLSYEWLFWSILDFPSEYLTKCAKFDGIWSEHFPIKNAMHLNKNTSDIRYIQYKYTQTAHTSSWWWSMDKWLSVIVSFCAFHVQIEQRCRFISQFNDQKKLMLTLLSHYTTKWKFTILRIAKIQPYRKQKHPKICRIDEKVIV